MTGDDVNLSHLTDEEAEEALLGPLLYGGVDTTADGPTAASNLGRVSAWLSMLAGKHISIGVSDPPTTDGEWVYLPAELPDALTPDQGAAVMRCMGLLQHQLTDLGLLSQTAWMTELHRDWVLQSVAQLLMANWIVSRWPHSHPGLQADLRTLQAQAELVSLRVGTTSVPTEGLPDTFSPLLRSLIPGLGHGPQIVQDLVDRTTDTPSAGLRLVIPGAAQRIREELRACRVGAPPIPRWVGTLHPAWFLGDPEADKARATAWKRGPSPLRRLRAVARRKMQTAGETAPASSWSIPPIKGDGELSYPEWDSAHSRYDHDATKMSIVDGATGPQVDVEHILKTHHQEAAEVRHQFALLRNESRWLHGQVDGGDLDIDRAVLATTTSQAGQQPSPRIYRRFQPAAQELAVLTLIDLTGSSQGALLREQQKAVVLFAEGLHELGIAHAFFGFNGSGPSACRSHMIKDWTDDPETVRKRLSGLVAGGGSRLGAHLRHSTALLQRRPEPRRVLLVISDGRPEDGEAYRGHYGVADTAMAAREAVRQGVHLHCISLDQREAPYLKTIFGNGAYTQVTDAAQLPRRLPEAFCRLIG